MAAKDKEVRLHPLINAAEIASAPLLPIELPQRYKFFKAKFFETAITSKVLGRTNIAVLALGSKLYPDFCKAGNLIEKKLIEEGGARTLMQLTCVDELKGSHSSISQWITMVSKLVMPPSLDAQLRLARGNKHDVPVLHRVKWNRVSMDISRHVHTHAWDEEETMLCKRNDFGRWP